MLGWVPTCMSISRSDGICAIGFSDGSVSLWGPHSLRMALEASEVEAVEKARIQADEHQNEAGTADDVSNGYRGGESNRSSVDGKDAVRASEDGNEAVEIPVGVNEDNIDGLPFMMNWDEKTGVE